MRSFAVAAAALLLAGAAEAKVASQGPTGFTVAYEADLKGAPQAAYEAFLSVADWWGADHTYSHDSKNLSIEAKNGGCWCEALPDGGFVRHMDVMQAAPARRLVMRGGLGPLAFMGVHAAMVVSFEKKGDDATHVTLRYAVGGRDENDFQDIAKGVDGVLSEQFARYVKYANGEKP